MSLDVAPMQSACCPLAPAFVGYFTFARRDCGDTSDTYRHDCFDQLVKLSKEKKTTVSRNCTLRSADKVVPSGSFIDDICIGHGAARLLRCLWHPFDFIPLYSKTSKNFVSFNSVVFRHVKSHTHGIMQSPNME